MSLAGLLSELTISVYPTGPHQTKSLSLTLTVIHTETSAMPNPSPLQYTVVCSKPKAVIRQTLTSVKFNCFKQIYTPPAKHKYSTPVTNNGSPCR